jgi:hypothetical protein
MFGLCLSDDDGNAEIEVSSRNCFCLYPTSVLILQQILECRFRKDVEITDVPGTATDGSSHLLLKRYTPLLYCEETINVPQTNYM